MFHCQYKASFVKLQGSYICLGCKKIKCE